MSVYNIEKSRKHMQELVGVNRELTGKTYDAGLAVKCSNGIFVGTETDKVRSYKGIPYAVPPVGIRRWKSPEPAPDGDGVYEAMYFGKSCIQTEEASERASMYIQGEDCLTLNIWTCPGKKTHAGDPNPVPDLKGDMDLKPDVDLKPVMVFIHGGSYGWGGTADPLYDGHNFVHRAKDIVLVTINYRIGLFGFIDFSEVPGGESYAASGNLGLLDQICALGWIRRNIRGFGGDPDNVTIFGESAGASSVSLLPLIDSARGLFRRVIAQSGSIAFTYSREEARTLTRKLLEKTGASCMEELAALDEDQIRAVNEELNDHNIFPVRDGFILPADLYEAYRTGKGSGVDMLIGTNADEARYWIGEMGSWFVYQCMAPVLVQSIIHSFKKEDKARSDAFMKLQKGTAVHRATEFFNELIFRVPSIVQAAFHSDNGGSTYMYYWTKKSSIPHFGACHAVELAYVFGNTEETIYTGKQADKKLSAIVQDMWTRFSRDGKPGTKACPWDKYDRGSRMTMVLGDEIRMVSDPGAENRVLIEPLLSYRYNGNHDLAGIMDRYLRHLAVHAAARLALTGTLVLGIRHWTGRLKDNRG